GARAFAGQDGRWTVGGSWLRRADPTDEGVKAGWERDGSAEGWSAVGVPDIWNAGDNSAASQAGGVVWYRRALRLPAVPRERRGGRWILRFERVSVRGTVWIDGTKVADHRGAYEPFEATIPAEAVGKDRRVNVVVRTDNRRQLSDFPPASTQKDGTPGGGWWNDGGIPREVGLRYADALDLSSVQLTPDVACRTCSGTLRARVAVTNVTGGTRKGELLVRVAGREQRLGGFRLKAGESREVVGRLTVPRPRLWSPRRPTLYVADARVRLTAGDRAGEQVARYRVRTGFRSVRIVAGRLQLNWKAVNLRGTGVHEMDVQHASALTDEGQDELLRQARDLGGLVIRGHYPFHPRILEEADRLGLLVWSEIPVYQVRQSQLGKRRVRDDALGQWRTMISTNAHHPAIFTWSAGNELTTNPGEPIAHYFRSARRVKDRMDPSRPMSYARQHGTAYGCVAAYAPIQLLGLNDYFGWYGAPGTTLADPANLGPWLDALHACHKQQALMITETGAEANHDGPATDAGTYAYQAAYAAYHLAVYRSRPWLSGALWWGLREFRVRPNWSGGNPFPQSPWHAKGLIDLNGYRKPAWHVLHDEIAGLDQLAPAPTTPVQIPASPPGPGANASTGEEAADGAAAPGD
ncbi:glycoside hydrolase family 2 protein, partial [Patulibacter sp. S7RM1-6]